MKENKMHSEKDQWLNDFQDFCDGGEIEPAAGLTSSITHFVHRDLNPSMLQVLSQFALIQAAVGGLSLFLCSQFGIGNGPLMHTFSQFGATICMALCGALFLGLGALVASFYLEKPELDLIRKSGYLPVLAIGVLSLGIFFGFGAEIVFGLGLAWLIGAFAGGLLALQAGSLLRARVHV